MLTTETTYVWTKLNRQVAMFFTAASTSDLKKFSSETQKIIFKTLGHKYDFVKRMTRQKIQELFSVMMELDALGSKSAYSEEDVSDYGYMWCGQKSAQAAKFSEDAIDGFFDTLKDCVHLESNTRGALVTKAISASGSLSDLLKDNPQRMENLGSMVMDMDLNLINALDETPKQVFVSSTQKVMESITKVQKETKQRPVSEISDTERKEVEDKVSKLGRLAFDLHLSVSFTSRRRKRSLFSADCATIQSFNGALSFLTTSDILSLPTNEFTDCLSEFQSTSWTSTQLEAFGTQLLTAFGSDTSTWTETNVLDAGILLDGLNSSHILGLNVLDDDTLSTLGTYTFTNNANHIVTSYMATQNVTDVSTITSSVLGNSGNLVCGFNSTQLAAMESTAVNTASSDLSSVSCLESEQLTTLSNKIVEVRGTDWSTTTSDSITSLGVLAGGLPVSVLEDLGPDQISSISSSAITNMDATTFAAVFTVNKISSLSSVQANAVTRVQLASLSPAQQSAVSQVATTTTDTGGDNGASDVKMTYTVVLMMMFFASFAHFIVM